MMNIESLDWIVHLKKGSLRGRYIKENNINYYSFLGIRYGQSPIGDLRFKAPIPVEAWNGVLDTFHLGPVCVQFESLILKEWTGQEDCLFLNVFIPEICSVKMKKLLPVLVYIHGGGFTHGSGNHYTPEYFMKNNSIILVTINYRLGPLGFCNLETSEIPGNAGLYDILLALQWIQENIINFNGNPENVTLCGFSAGAGAAHLLALSPLSKGLFHKAILISGCALNYWVAKPSCKSNSIKLAQSLGFSGNDDDIKSITKILKTTPAMELFKNINKAYNIEEKEEIFELIFVPNWKTGYTNDKSFFPLPLTELIHQCKIPILFGMASLEGGGLIDEIQEKSEHNEYFSKKPELLVPKYIRNLCNGNVDQIKQYCSQIKKYFFNNEKLQIEISQDFLELISHQSFILEIFQSIKLHVETSSSIYVYVFDQDINNNSLGRHLFKLNNCDFTSIRGAFHGDDHRYIFPLKEIFPQDLSREEDNLMKNMISLFCNFSCNGKLICNNTSTNSLFLSKPYKNEDPNYLQISNYSLINKNQVPFQEKYEFWSKIISEINLNQ